MRDLVRVYDIDGTQRGFRSGHFRRESEIGLILGKLSGLTGAGTHRGPAFEQCRLIGSYRQRVERCGSSTVPRVFPSNGWSAPSKAFLVCPGRS